MNDRDLAALEHDNWIAYLAGAIACGENPLVTHEQGIVTLLSGVPVRLFNQIMVEDDDASADGIVHSVARARERGDRFAVCLRDATDDRFAPAAEAAGLVSTGLDEAMPGMAWHPIEPEGLRTRTGPRFEVRQVTDEAGVAQHVHTLTEGFGTDPLVAPSVVCVELARRDGWAVYVGYEDGAPVSVGLGVRTGRTVGVYNIATVERARGRGYGQAITAKVVADGVAAGCDVAILQASNMGRPIYERMGFRTVVQYLRWVDPDRSR